MSRNGNLSAFGGFSLLANQNKSNKMHRCSHAKWPEQCFYGFYSNYFALRRPLNSRVAARFGVARRHWLQLYNYTYNTSARPNRSDATQQTEEPTRSIHEMVFRTAPFALLIIAALQPNYILINFASKLGKSSRSLFHLRNKCVVCCVSVMTVFRTKFPYNTIYELSIMCMGLIFEIVRGAPLRTTCRAATLSLCKTTNIIYLFIYFFYLFLFCFRTTLAHSMCRHQHHQEDHIQALLKITYVFIYGF